MFNTTQIVLQLTIVGQGTWLECDKDNESLVGVLLHKTIMCST